MALYKSSSPSVNNTTTIKDPLTANNHHHLHHQQQQQQQHFHADKRSIMDNDHATPAKRTRLSMTNTEPNVTVNTTMLPPTFATPSTGSTATVPANSHPAPMSPMESETTTITTLLATNEHNTTASQLQDKVETSQQTSTPQLDETLAQQNEDTVVSIPSPKSTIINQLPLHQHDPVLKSEADSQEQGREITLSSCLSSVSHESTSVSQQQQDTVGPTETLHPISTQQEHEIAVSLSPPLSATSISGSTGALEQTQQQETRVSLSPPLPTTPNHLPPPPPLISQQPQEASETVATPPQLDSTTQQLEEPTVTLLPSLLTQVPPITTQKANQQDDTSAIAAVESDSCQVAPSVSTLKEEKALSPRALAPTVTEGRSKRNRKPVDYNGGIWKTFDRKIPGKRKSSVTPRWYTQSYMMFLALREHPDHCLSRPDLINAALAMDKKISKERNLPRVFQSKTPMNSASAVLTHNADRYYISYKPEGSRSTWFRLAYSPGNFDHAYGEYRRWIDKLVNHDWLYCFGVPLENSTPMTMDEIAAITPFSSTALSTTNTSQSTTTTTDTEKDGVTEKSAVPVDDNINTNNNGSIKENSCATMEPSRSTSTITDNNNNNSSSSDNVTTKPLPVKDTNRSETSTTTSVQTFSPSSSSSSSSSSSANDNTTTKLDQVNSEHPPQPMYRLDQLDLSNVPTSWQDIVRVDTSTIPNAGQGLFAVRELPYNTPLGFYFGVPMTEYEFDSIKENVGRASEYSIMYRKTILDATDDQGEPYTITTAGDNKERLCPFHYMNEAMDVNMANILFVEGVVVNQVICWSKRNIMPGEELLVWYGKEVNRYWKDGSDE